MTSSVIVSAHCADTKEVEVTINDNITGETLEYFRMQNGEEATRHVYDDVVIRVNEVKK